MGVFARGQKPGEQQPGGSGLEIDLDLRACPRCRRDLHPWQATCPDDGAEAVARAALPRGDLPPVPAALLEAEDGEEAEADGLPGAADGG